MDGNSTAVDSNMPREPKSQGLERHMIHSLCELYLRWFGEYIRLRPNLTLLASHDSMSSPPPMGEVIVPNGTFGSPRTRCGAGFDNVIINSICPCSPWGFSCVSRCASNALSCQSFVLPSGSNSIIVMARQNSFLGLRGSRLKVAMVLLVVAPSFLLFGYNNGSTGGIATLESFVKVSASFIF